MRIGLTITSIVAAVICMTNCMAKGQDFTESLVSVVLQGKKVDSPRIAVSPDGRLLVCARRLEPSPATLLLYASDDLGKTWTMIHDFKHNYYGPSVFALEDDIYLLLRDTIPGNENLVLAKSEDGGKTWKTIALLPPTNTKRELRFSPGRTTGNTPILVTEEFIIAAVSDWGGTGGHFPQAGRIACGWCPISADPMNARNWNWTDFLEMPEPNSAPDDKGGWLEPNPVIGPNGDLLLVARVDSSDGELGAVVRVNMKERKLQFEDSFPATPGQTGFIRMPGGGNGMFFVWYDEPSQRYLCASNPRTGGATPLWGHTRIRNCLALFESTDLYRWKWVRALIRDDQPHDWKTSATRTGFQQPSWVRVNDDLYVVSRTAYGMANNWHDANSITLHKLTAYRQYLDADGEVAHYSFDKGKDLGIDSSRQGGNKGVPQGVRPDTEGRHGGCARFNGQSCINLHYRVSSEFHYAEQIGITFWVYAEKPDGQIIDFPIDQTRNGVSVSLRNGKLVVGGRSCVRDAWQNSEFPFPGIGQWSHIAVLIDYRRKLISAWVNGKKAGGDVKVQFSLPYYKRQFPSVFDVVGRNHNGAASFVGRLDEMRFFRRALRPHEIDGVDPVRQPTIEQGASPDR